MCGSKFEQSTDVSTFTESTIFCEASDSTHYLYYDAPSNKTVDPYEVYQLNNTHGNCFIFALYISAYYNNTATFGEVGLINISNLMQTMGGKIKFKVVNPKMKQIAYKTFVHNDFVAINLLLNFLTNHPSILNMYELEWDKISRKKKIYYGILIPPNSSKRISKPTPKPYTFSEYFKDFCELAKSKKNTYIMTLDQIKNWDLMENALKPYENSGIKNANEIKVDDYEFP